MKCPKCQLCESRVIDSRDIMDGGAIRRRRECNGCGARFSTLERIIESLPMVVKRGGERELFDREKILSGLRKACEKRPVSVEQIENLGKEVELEIRDLPEREVSSVWIGEMVIEKLKLLDQVAYVRFASVYRKFSDVGEFVDTLRELVEQGISKKSILNKPTLNKPTLNKALAGKNLELRSLELSSLVNTLEVEGEPSTADSVRVGVKDKHIHSKQEPLFFQGTKDVVRVSNDNK